MASTCDLPPPTPYAMNAFIFSSWIKQQNRLHFSFLFLHVSTLEWIPHTGKQQFIPTKRAPSFNLLMNANWKEEEKCKENVNRTQWLMFRRILPFREDIQTDDDSQKVNVEVVTKKGSLSCRRLKVKGRSTLCNSPLVCDYAAHENYSQDVTRLNISQFLI